MLASNTMMDYWFRQSPRITTSQIWCPGWGHPQSFVWSGTACMGETRKHSFPNAWDMGPPTSLKVPGKPSGLLAALASLSLTFCLEILVWTWSLSLSDGFAKTGTHLQIITVHPKMHSTVSKKIPDFLCLRFVTQNLLFCFTVMTGKLTLQNTVHSIRNIILVKILTEPSFVQLY